MSFKVVTFESNEGLQDRPRWLQWRQQGIGSSDAAVIMGVSRFNDWETLLSSKAREVAEEDNQNAYIKERGNKIEFQVRMFLEKQMEKSFNSKNTEHTVFPFLRASLDGASEDGRSIIEIKLLSSVNPAKVNTEAAGYIKWLAARNGEVPKEYYPQIQHQLFITGAEVCFFVGYKEVKGNQIVTEDKLAVIPVYPNKEYQEKLFLESCRFWYKVIERREEETKRIEKELE
jgi:putative phage-type endonuclease